MKICNQFKVFLILAVTSNICLANNYQELFTKSFYYIHEVKLGNLIELDPSTEDEIPGQFISLYQINPISTSKLNYTIYKNENGQGVLPYGNYDHQTKRSFNLKKDLNIEQNIADLHQVQNYLSIFDYVKCKEETCSKSSVRLYLSKKENRLINVSMQPQNPNDSFDENSRLINLSINEITNNPNANVLDINVFQKVSIGVFSGFSYYISKFKEVLIEVISKSFGMQIEESKVTIDDERLLQYSSELTLTYNQLMLVNIYLNDLLTNNQKSTEKSVNEILQAEILRIQDYIKEVSVDGSTGATNKMEDWYEYQEFLKDYKKGIENTFSDLELSNELHRSANEKLKENFKLSTIDEETRKNFYLNLENEHPRFRRTLLTALIAINQVLPKVLIKE